MKGKIDDKKAKCPFFVAHARDCIVCESPIPGSVVTTRYKRVREKETQYRVFCCGKYKNCEMYEATERKYDQED